jgi:DNA processing protein
MESRTRDWVVLHLARGLGDRRKRLLVERLGSPGKALALGARGAAEVLSSPPDALRRFVSDRPDAAVVERALAGCGAVVLAWDDPRYPSLLKETYDPPLVLFFRGDPSLLAGPTVGIVGARGADPGAAAWTAGMAAVLAASGFVVASGLARGIDEAAHRGAIEGGGRTAAVLGTGLDTVYPPENRALAVRIAETGLLLTELPPGSEPLRAHFPRRNRILAGLCSAVVIAQASEKSGAMITARLALEAGREVLVLAAPPWDPRFAGNRKLAREGAVVVQDGEEIALHLGGSPAARAPGRDPLERLTGVEREIAGVLAGGPRTADEVCRATGRGPAEVLPVLLGLELGGSVEERAGRVFALVNVP